MSIYDYTVKAREGATLNLADMKGKVLLIVNTRGWKSCMRSITIGASRCWTSPATSLGTRPPATRTRSMNSAP